MRPASAREGYWLSEVQWSKTRCKNSRTQIWKRFVKRRLSKARRADGRQAAREALSEEQEMANCKCCRHEPTGGKMPTYDSIVVNALEGLAGDEALYGHGLTDDEGTLLLKWAEGRIGIALAGVTNEAEARRAVMNEVGRLRQAFQAIACEIENIPEASKRDAVVVVTGVLSDLWNGGVR